MCGAHLVHCFNDAASFAFNNPHAVAAPGVLANLIQHRIDCALGTWVSELGFGDSPEPSWARNGQHIIAESDIHIL